MDAETQSSGRRFFFSRLEVKVVCGLIAVAFTVAARPASALNLPTAAPRSTPLPVTVYLAAQAGIAGSVAGYALGSGGTLTLTATIGNDNPSAVAVDLSGNIYVLNSNNNSVSIYAPGTGGEASPPAQISGSKTGLSAPSGIAVDSLKRIYVTNGQSVLIFASSSKGNVAPMAQIAGTATGLCSPRALAIGTEGVYVANSGVGPCGANGPSITVYWVGSSGNVLPRTGLPNVSASSLALDAQGTLYVTNAFEISEYGPLKGGAAAAIATIQVPPSEPAGAIAVDAAGNLAVASGDSILLYPAGSKGTVAPSAILSGDITGLARPSGLAIGRNNNLYVANMTGGPGFSGSVTVYAPGSAGDASPAKIITIADTGIFQPVGVASDLQSNIYVASGASLSDAAGDQGPGGVSVFPPGSNGAVSPSARIFGPSTELDEVQGVAVDAAGKIYVLNYVPGEDYSVATFAAGSSGDVAPLSTLDIGSEVGGFAVDAAGNIYASAVVAGTRYVSLLMYPVGGSATSPSAMIADSQTELADAPSVIAVDTDGSIYSYETSKAGVPSLLVFAPGSDGDIAPTRDITGSKSLLRNIAGGVVVDASGTIYVTGTKGSPSLNIYPAGSNGNVAPEFSITGAALNSAFSGNKGFLAVVAP